MESILNEKIKIEKINLKNGKFLNFAGNQDFLKQITKTKINIFEKPVAPNSMNFFQQ